MDKKSATIALNDEAIVLYVLYVLGGWQNRVHTEDIALKCHELAPSKFSWVKYPQYPDITPARFALEAAKKLEHGALVKGESERKRNTKSIGGWMLTQNGVRWVNDNKERIELSLGRQTPIGNRLPMDRKVKQLLNSSAYNKFGKYGYKADISRVEFVESLICTVNTKPKILVDRLDQLYSIAEKLNRDDIRKYIDYCRDRFAPLLRDREEEADEN